MHFNQFSEAMNLCSLEDYYRRRSTIKHELFEGFVDALNLVEILMKKITMSDFNATNLATQQSVFMDAESFAIEKSFMNMCNRIIVVPLKKVTRMFKKLALSALVVLLLTAKVWAFYFPSPDLPHLNIGEWQKFIKLVNQQLINNEIMSILNISCNYTRPPLKNTHQISLGNILGLCHV
jgi:hypothetical protein